MLPDQWSWWAYIDSSGLPLFLFESIETTSLSIFNEQSTDKSYVLVALCPAYALFLLMLFFFLSIYLNIATVPVHNAPAWFESSCTGQPIQLDVLAEFAEYSCFSDFVFEIRLIRLGFSFQKEKILYLNSQITDSQSGVITITPQTFQSCLTDSSWIHLILLIQLI